MNLEVRGNYSEWGGKKLYRDAERIAQAKNPQVWFDIEFKSPVEQAIAITEAEQTMEHDVLVTVYERGKQ